MTKLPTEVVREVPVYQSGANNQYSFESMEPGWTFFARARPGQGLESLRVSILTSARRFRPKQFVTSITREKGVDGVRCWCVEGRPGKVHHSRGAKPANAEVWRIILNRCGGRYGIATRLGCEYLTVCNWIKGVTTPHPSFRAQLREFCHTNGLPDPFDLEELNAYTKPAPAEVDIFS